MAVNFNWFIKITRLFGSGSQNQDCKAKSKIDHDENKSEQTFLPDQIKELFWFWTGDSLFIDYCCCFFYVSIYYVHISISVALMAWPSRDAVIVFLFLFLLLILVNIYYCMLSFWGHADPWIFPFFSIDWVENSIVPFEISIASALCWASFRSTVRSTQGKSSQPYCCSHSHQVAPSCVHLVVK